MASANSSGLKTAGLNPSLREPRRIRGPKQNRHFVQTLVVCALLLLLVQPAYGQVLYRRMNPGDTPSTTLRRHFDARSTPHLPLAVSPRLDSPQWPARIYDSVPLLHGW
jgi:hypothetical protein